MTCNLKRNNESDVSLSAMSSIIIDAQEKGYTIAEVQMPMGVVLSEIKKRVIFKEPSGIIVGTLFGYPFRDSYGCRVITVC